MTGHTNCTKNRNNSRIRARVEHVFGVVKRLWGFGKVRYRGLAKKTTRAFTPLALANIDLACHPKRRACLVRRHWFATSSWGSTAFGVDDAGAAAAAA